MSKELIVSAGRHETKVAILDDDQGVELFHEREKEYSLAGSIHKGRVTRVLPGMQAAFVDVGLERDAFLYVSDVAGDVAGMGGKDAGGAAGGGGGGGGGELAALPAVFGSREPGEPREPSERREPRAPRAVGAPAEAGEA